MADQVFLVNSASFQDFEVSSSLRAGPGSIVNLTQASTTTGSFSGDGSNLKNVSASFIVAGSNTTASIANTASYIGLGASFYQVSGSNGVSPSFIIPYDYSIGNNYLPTPNIEGKMFYDGYFHDWAHWMYYDTSSAGSAQWRIHLGKEVTVGIHNPVSSTLPRLTAIYVSGSTGGGFNPDAYYAIADGTGTKDNVMGVVRSAIGSGSNGYCLMRGVMHRTDTTVLGAAVGQPLYLSPTIPGGLTPTKPGDPHEVIQIGYISELGINGSFIVDIHVLTKVNVSFAGMTSIPAISDALNSSSVDFTHSLYIGTGSVNLYTDPTGNSAIFNFPLLPITLSVPIGGNTLYAIATTNGVTASYGITNDFSSINYISVVPVATIYRADVDAHWIETNEEGLALANKLNKRLVATERFVRQDGFSLQVTGSRYFTITGGTAWVGATQFTEGAFDSRITGSDFQSGSFNETHFAYHSASNWIIPTTNGQYENRYYDNGINLIPLSSGSYTINYIFRIFGENNSYDEDVFYLLSNAQYTSIQDAQSDIVPINIPTVLEDIGLLVGRIIIQSGSNSASLVESSFIQTFGTSIINTHNNLGGLQGSGPEYYHLSFTDYTGTGTGIIVRQNNPIITGLNATGSLKGTASYAITVISSSWASSSFSSSYSITSSYALNAAGTLPTYAISASWVSASVKITTADTASYITSSNIVGTLSATQAPIALSASWVSASVKITTADTASYVTSSNIAGTLTSTQVPIAVSASWVSASVKITTADTASYVTASNVKGTVTSASYALNGVMGGSNFYSPVWISNSLSTTSSIYADGQRTAIGSASFDPSDPEVLAVWGNNIVDANSIAAFYHTTNSYAQVVIQNRSGSNSASADLIMQSDVPASQNLGYIDIGINNRGYSESFFNINGPLDGYLLAVASGSVGGNLAIGCDTSTKQIQFVVGGFTIANQIMQISDTSPQVQITGSLQVTAGITGSLQGTATTASYISSSFSRGGTFYDPLGLAGTSAATQNVIVWRAPYACTVTNVWGYRVTGSSATINARRNGIGTIATGSNISLTSTDTWISASSLITTSFSVGDKLEIMLISSSGYPTQIAVQCDLTR